MAPIRRGHLPWPSPRSGHHRARAGAVGRLSGRQTTIAARVATQEHIEAGYRRLRTDRAYYAEKCLHVVDEGGELVRLKPRKAQTKLYVALASQRARGLPQRVIYLKSRKVGVSTATQGVGVQDTTLNANWRSLVVAQDNETAGELFDIADQMYANLPDDPILKPPIASRQTSRGGAKMLHFGEPSRYEQARGNLGLNSTLKIDTAKEVSAGRGKTIRFLHASEVAFWPDPRKALSLLNAVPDHPDTVVILESTAQGHNFFKQRWDRAMRGEGAFQYVFIGWTDDENCTKAFPDPDERARFIAGIGRGVFGEDEPRLIEKFGCTPEQLNWRRDTITDKTEGKLELFKQEYPASPEEAFVGSGKHVFSIVFIQRAVDRAEAVEALKPDEGGPQEGVIKEVATRKRRFRDTEIDVPTSAIWVPRSATGFAPTHDFWTRWEIPDERTEQEKEHAPLPPRQCIVAVDPAGGEKNTQDERAFHAIQVIDHRTHEQLAQLETRRLDPDQLAKQALLAALAYGNALISVETTGGYGMPVARVLWDLFGWRRMYRRRNVKRSDAPVSDTLGFDTNTRTKPMLIALMTEKLREDTHGIRSLRLALQLTTYVEKNGKQVPDEDAYADLLTAYMQAQEVARQTPLRPDGSGEGPVSTWTRSRTDERTGW